MNNAPTAGGRGPGGPQEAEPLFPSEGAFNTVVPLSEVGRAPAHAPLKRVDPADAGQPSEAAWARARHSEGSKDEEEATLVPARRTRGARRAAGAAGARPPWVATAVVLILSVSAGLASGAYLLWSSGGGAASRQADTPAAPVAPATQDQAQVEAAEATSLPPASAPTPVPPAAESAGVSEAGKVKEVEKERESGEVARSTKAATPAAERAARTAAAPPPVSTSGSSTRAAAAPRAVAPEPKPARVQPAAPARTRATTAARRTPAPAAPARTLPVSSPPPSARTKKVIQWP